MSEPGGVDVVVSSLGGGSSPLCVHGPTLLFERYTEDGMRRFYACSACRDRKTCSFFQWADQCCSESKTKARLKLVRKRMKSPFTSSQYRERLKEFRCLPVRQRVMCLDCGHLLLPAEFEGHKGHDLKTKVTKTDLRRPSYLLRPLDNNKTNAQYLFSKQTLDFLVKTLNKFHFKKVLCIGTPRIHEEIMEQHRTKSSRMQSLLLDIDQRLEQFFPKKNFCRYNMFNNYFFHGEKSRKLYRDFLSCGEGSLVVVMDPPFGGMVDVLAHTVQQVTSDWQSANEGSEGKPDFLWIFPYFMENRITKCCPAFKMLDYKVEYDNHTVYSGKSRPSTKGSPVRVFTTLDPSSVQLPADNYRFCEVCRRYVFKDTRHCKDCNQCTSQDGRQYVHCHRCDRCVKPSWCHCVKCDTCHLPDYKCQQPKTGCHICGAVGHKRRECPIRHDTAARRKRKQEVIAGNQKKMKK